MKDQLHYKKFLWVLILLIVAVSKAAYASEYIGRAEAVQSVQIRSEVSAKINKIHFKEGSFVNKGSTLFTLNSAIFYAEVSLKKAELSHAQANLDGASKYLSRLKATDKRGVSASDLEAADSEVKKARALVEEAKAALKISQIQLNYTRITAPFSGKIGKVYSYSGSYVSPENILCEIVQLDPIRIVLPVPDRDYLSLRNSTGNFKYELILPDGSLFSGDVEKDFEDNSMNPETGSINIWLKVSNKDNVLLPGSIVRVKIIEGN